MKWIYGKQDWKTLERGQENCFLMTNYLGGFSSLTVLGSVARNDHALLMASVQAPNHRVNMLHRMAEKVEIGKEEHYISSQEFADGKREEGYRYLSCFTYEDTPVWRFQVKGVEIRKEIAMKREANTIGIRYEIQNRGNEVCKLVLTPFFQFTPKGIQPDKAQTFVRGDGCISSNRMILYYRTNGKVTGIEDKTEIYYYSYDVCDGRREQGCATGNHEISYSVDALEHAALEVVYEMKPSNETVDTIISGLKEYRHSLEYQAGFHSEVARMLSKSANQFIAKRESTGGETILAGYPFFEDWGRDTMIALPGLCISTGQYESAKKILYTFAINERNGLVPNLFPEGGNEPKYNTVDAALLFINCVYLYYKSVDDEEFIREMYPVMERIIEGYQHGTEYAIHMDEDGLILAGEGLDQVTWMDVRAGEILPTPRHGKPVEINAYWYNALCIMEQLGAVLGRTEGTFRKLAKLVKESFEQEFWMEDKKCLKDVVSGTDADYQIRCNQIWAVSMPFTMLDREKEKKIVDAVFEKLYTPYGLRSLEEMDAQFHGYYGGSVFERDMAYHQGTVWVFPLGGYYLAYLKVHDYSEKAKGLVREQLEVLESAMREGCIGQLPEIYDGKNPCSSKGCFAQAWSVGEMLRVYEAIEKQNRH